MKSVYRRLAEIFIMFEMGLTEIPCWNIRDEEFNGNEVHKKFNERVNDRCESLMREDS